MNKIVEYIMAKGIVGNEKQFNDQVNRMIKDGFQPLGGVAIAADNSVLHFTQAMVKYQEPRSAAPVEPLEA